MKVTDIVKKDGSVSMTGSLEVQGDWRGTRVTNGKGDKCQIIIKSDAVLGFQIHPFSGENTETIELGLSSIAPVWNRNKQFSLGRDASRWKEIYVGSSYLSGTSGYSTLNNGLLLQWKKINMVNGWVQHTYPTSFPNGTLSLGLSMSDQPNSNAGTGRIQPYETKSSCNVYGANISGAEKAYIWAIGY